MSRNRSKVSIVSATAAEGSITNTFPASTDTSLRRQKCDNLAHRLNFSF
jgi:hypothetical protein